MPHGVIETVRGPLEVGELGWTLPHEHIVVGMSGAELDPFIPFDRSALVALAVARLVAARDRGLGTIVDLTTIEMGRDPELLREISVAAEVNIVCTTGFFTEEVGIPHHFRFLSETDLTEILVREVEVGIGSTGIRAGVLKAASGGHVLTELEERMFRVVAAAQQRTGVPVLTHTGRGGGGLRQLDILLAGGVPPDKIVVGHSDVSGNLKYHLRLIERGAFVGFDRVGQLAFASDEVRAGCVATLIHMGHQDQLTLSLDAHVAWRGRPNALVDEDREFTYLQQTFFPLVERMGVSPVDLESIMVDNVRRLFR